MPSIVSLNQTDKASEPFPRASAIDKEYSNRYHKVDDVDQLKSEYLKGMRMYITMIRVGIDYFFMIGQWVEPGGGVPNVFKSGRDLAQII